MKKKLIALLCASVMVLSVMACGAKEETPAETPAASESAEAEAPVEEKKEPVTIAYWYWNATGPQEYTDEVEAKLNEILAKTEGAEHITIELHPTKDYTTDLQLAQAGGEQIDVVSTPGLDFATELSNGTFMPIDDLLANNSEAIDELPDWMVEAGKVNGETYLVCNYQQAANATYFCIPKEYMEMSGYTVEQMQEILGKIEKGDADAVDKIAEMFENIVLSVREKTGKETKWIGEGVFGNPVFWYNGGAKDLELSWRNFMTWNRETNQLEAAALSDNVKKAYVKMGELYDKGIVHPDVTTITPNDFRAKNFMNDESFCFMINAGVYGDTEMASKFFTDSYGFDMVAFPIWEKNYVPAAVPAGGVGISSTSEHPEEAMQILSMLQNSKYSEFYNTLVYGLEGVHYEKLDENSVKTLEYDGTQASGEASYSYWKWVGGNTFHAWVNQSTTLEMRDYILNDFNEGPNTISSPLVGFTFDTSEVSVEYAQLKAIGLEYLDDGAALHTGIKGEEGTKALLAEFEEKMENAGLSKFLDTLNAQAQEFLNNK